MGNINWINAKILPVIGEKEEIDVVMIYTDQYKRKRYQVGWYTVANGFQFTYSDAYAMDISPEYYMVLDCENIK